MQHKSILMRTLGMILVIIGLVMTLFTGIRTVTHKHVADVGPIEISKTETRTPVYWSPWTGLVLAAIGGAILIFSRRENV
jgi:hypothetical protein